MRVELVSRAVAVGILVSMAGALGGCGGSSSGGDKPSISTTRPTTATQAMLDTRKVADAITDSVREQRHVRAKVECPQSVRQAKGVNFVCQATSKFGVTQFAVVQRDAAGHVTYTAAE